MNIHSYFLKGFLIIPCLFIILNSANAQQTQKPVTISKEIKIAKPDNSCFRIYNSSASTSVFALNVNDNLCSSAKMISDAVRSQCKDKDSLYYYCWKYVCDNTYGFSSLTNEPWVTSMAVYLNSVGFGSSEQQAILLAKIWKLFGYKTQIWRLGNYYIPEVNYNGRFHMLDPFSQVYYLDSKNEIAGVKDLNENPDLISNQKKPVRVNVLYFLRYSEDAAKSFKSYEGRMPMSDDELMNTEVLDSLLFEIPPKASLQFPGIYVQNVMSTKPKKVPFYANCKLIIPPNWKGTVNNSLVIAAIRGKGKLKIGDAEYQAGDEKLNARIKSYVTIIPEISIENSNDTMEIIYFINPALTQVKANNTLKFYGNNVEGLALGSRILADSNSVASNLRNQYFFFGSCRTRLLMKELSAYTKCITGGEYKNKDEFISRMSNYLSCIYKNEKKDHIAEVIMKVSGAFSDLPADYDLNKVLYMMNNIPSNLLFYEFENADRELIVRTLSNITK